MNIQRYNPIVRNGLTHDVAVMIPDEKGMWISYQDYTRPIVGTVNNPDMLIESLRAALDYYRCQLKDGFDSGNAGRILSGEVGALISIHTA